MTANFSLLFPVAASLKLRKNLPFKLRKAGYQPPVVIDMSTTNENWQGEVRSKYDIRLLDGKYGRIDFHFLPYNGAFTVQSAINPSGSRNLEPQ